MKETAYTGTSCTWDRQACSGTCFQERQKEAAKQMKFTDDELVILMIYAEETRGKTIESIRGMIYRTAIDETELREMGNSAIRKLEQLTDEEYEDMDIYNISDAL